jgi:hypothetical protein
VRRHRLTWIHLSDLHMKAGDQFNRSVVLSSLWRDIEALRNRGLQADFAAFTGDVAFHGSKDEYNLAASEFFHPLLKATGLARNRLFLVPGNHDIEREKTQLLNNPLLSQRPRDTIHELVQNQDNRGTLLSPLTNYRTFVQSLGGPSSFAKNCTFGYRSLINVRNLPVTIVGLNSAWLCGFNRNSKGEVDDSRHLAVSEFQLSTCTLGESRLMIVLMHHPPDWLMEPEQLLVEKLLANRRAIFLRGHLHWPDLVSKSNLDGAFVTIPAGAVFEQRKSPNAYNFVQVDFDTGMGTIHFRRYNDRRMEWQKDTESTGDVLDGVVSFQIPTHRSQLAVHTSYFQKPARLNAADFRFTRRCLTDLRSLGLGRSSVRSLLQAELESHPAYFAYDLYEYPLQLGSEYILFLDKVGTQFELRHVVACTKNEKQLTAWRSIVAHYRGLMTMSYREDPATLAFKEGTALRVCELHQQLADRMKDYYQTFERIGTTSYRKRHSSRMVSAKDGRIDPVRIQFHLDASLGSCSEIQKLLALLRRGDIEPGRAVGLLVAALEQSLQHFHKLISIYPPQGT